MVKYERKKKGVKDVNCYWKKVFEILLINI